MAIQMRRGNGAKFLPSKLLPGEWAVVLNNDPTTGERAVYVCFEAGTVKRMVTEEDLSNEIYLRLESIIAELTDGVEEAVTDAGNAAVSGLNNRIDSITQKAVAATERAEWAAGVAEDAAEGVGDVSQSLDILALNVCTSGYWIDKAWIVDPDDVSWDGEYLTVDGAYFDGEAMVLPTRSCSAGEAKAVADEAWAGSQDLAWELSVAKTRAAVLEERLASLEGSLDALALNSGSYPFRVGKTLYVSGVYYEDGYVVVPTATYEGGAMQLGDM